MKRETDEEMKMAEKSPEAIQLKQALKAFKKRLKLMRLDAESNIGGGPLSGGRDSGIVAITPPDQFPPEVWDTLVQQGKLRALGNGIYELLDPG